MYSGQEATVRAEHGTTNWFKIGNGVRQAYILSPCSFNLHVVSCEMSGWMKFKPKTRQLGEILIISDMQMMPPLWQKVKRN